MPIKSDRRPEYCLTTNGSLLNENILEFLEEHNFLLILSFDGLAQDISRKKGSFDFLVSLIPQILARPRISLETNSVFSPETVGHLSASVRYIVEMGVGKMNVNLADGPTWTPASLLRLKEEITRVAEYFESRYRSPQDAPWELFYGQPKRAVFGCSAGQTKMALSAQGTLWGCHLFPHYFMEKKSGEGYRKYCFGDIDSFLKNPRRIYDRKIRNYADLCMDRFSTAHQECLMCREIEVCSICPLAAALTTHEIGRIPEWRCQGGKMLREEKRLSLERFERKIRGTGQKLGN